jgi:hypothetical protein
MTMQSDQVQYCWLLNFGICILKSLKFVWTISNLDMGRYEQVETSERYDRAE